MFKIPLIAKNAVSLENLSLVGYDKISSGHVPDTPQNRDLLQETCNNEANYLGTDKHGNRWYAQVMPDGRQVWVATRDGIIQDCGINDSARSFDSGEGFCQPKSKGVINNMKTAPARKAFLALFHLLDDLYSCYPYNNLCLQQHSA